MPIPGVAAKQQALSLSCSLEICGGRAGHATHKLAMNARGDFFAGQVVGSSRFTRLTCAHQSHLVTTSTQQLVSRLPPTAPFYSRLGVDKLETVSSDSNIQLKKEQRSDERKQREMEVRETQGVVSEWQRS